jgi:hypothetical protein
MTLTVHKLTTRCRSPQGLERPGALVDDVARGPLRSELQACLGPSLDRLPPVIRLKELRVRVKIASRDLNPVNLATAWARAFTLAIHRALARPPGDGAVVLRRYESDAAYRAAMMHHIATQGLASCWEFPELARLGGGSTAEAASIVLLSDSRLSYQILAELERRGWLDLLLMFWGELSLERIMRAMAVSDRQEAGLSLENLIELGRAAATSGGLRTRWPIGSRRQAIRLWVHLQQRLPLRGVWHGLRLLSKCLEIPALLMLRDPRLLADAIPFPGWCETIVTGGAAPADGGSAPEAGYASGGLLAVLELLRPLVPSAASSTAAAHPAGNMMWVASDCAGVLLLLPIVRRLDLTRWIRKPQFACFGGLRSLSFLLAGMGMTLLKPWSPIDPVDPAVAIFAGMLLEPDVAGMRQFFSQTNASAIADFVQAENWPEALDRAATELSLTFAGQVRGFRKASRDAVVKQFLRVRGRVLLQETRLLVVLEPTPWAVALHLSGMDAPLEKVEWLGQRRADFVLEGL